MENKNSIRGRYHNLLNNSYSNKEIIEIENKWEKEFWNLDELRKPIPFKVKKVNLEFKNTFEEKRFYKHLAGSRKLIECFQIPTEELEERENILFWE